MSQTTRDGGATAPAKGAFELERFSWGGPDRLSVSGRFVGLAVTDREPVLAVRGPAGTQRLVAVPGSVSGSPDDGGRWRAEFAWRDAPTAFEAAELELGDDLVVALPEPGARRRPFGRQVFEVRSTGTPEHSAPAEEAAAPATAEHVRLRADLLVAQEEALRLRAELDRAHEELATTRAALDDERKRHAEAVERFRNEVLEVGASAEQAVGAATQRLEQRVGELEGPAAEAEALRARVGELERAAADARALRGEHDRLRDAVEETRSGLEALLRRLPENPASGAGDQPSPGDG